MKTRKLLFAATTMIPLMVVAGDARAYYDPGVQRWLNRDPAAESGHAIATHLDAPRSVRPPGGFVFALNNPLFYEDPLGLEDIPKAGDRPSLRDCMTAKKLLKEYERLMKKMGNCIPPKRLEELDRKKNAETITSDDLPGSLQREFPGRFKGWTLEEIINVCDR